MFEKLDFTNKVHEIVRNIPKGNVLTYKQVAAKAGSPKACRAIGSVLNKNYNLEIPCHRVIRSDNSLGGYNRGSENKRRLLEQEGYEFKD